MTLYFNSLFTTPTRTIQNCLVLSAVVFAPPTRQDKTVLSRRNIIRPRRRCEQAITVAITKHTTLPLHSCVEDRPHSFRLERRLHHYIVQGQRTEVRLQQLQTNHFIVRTWKSICTYSVSSDSTPRVLSMHVLGGNFPPPKKLAISPKNFGHVGNYNLNVEGQK